MIGKTAPVDASPVGGIAGVAGGVSTSWTTHLGVSTESVFMITMYMCVCIYVCAYMVVIVYIYRMSKYRECVCDYYVYLCV